MPFVPVPNTVEVALMYVRDGQQCRTVIHFEKAAGGDLTGEDLSSLGAAINAAWVSHLGSIFDTVTFYRGCTLADISGPDGIAVEVPQSPIAQGGLAGAPLPDNVALAIKKLTLRRGRSFRGRIFHFGITGVCLADSGHVTSGTLTTFLNQYNLFFTAIGAAEPLFNHVVVSRYSGVANVFIDGRNGRRPIPRETGITTEVIALQADSPLDSQRRRLPGRGN